MNRLKIPLLLFFVLTFLTGCWDRKELEEISYAIAIGLDIPEGIDLEKDQAFDVTFQFSNPKQNMQGATSETGEKEIITLTAPDFVTAKNTANSFVTRQISLIQSKVIVVSEELARSDYFFRIIGTALKEREIRRETQLIVTDGKASDFLKKNKPEMQIRPHRYYQFVIDRSIETGLVPESSLNRFLAITDGDADLFLSMFGSVKEAKDESKFNEEDQYIAGHVPKDGGNQAQLIGSAVFKEGKMIGKLTGEETRSAMILDNSLDMEDMYVSYTDPIDDQYKIVVRLKKKDQTDVKVKLRKGPPKINVVVPISAEILSAPSMVDYSSNEKHLNKLRATISREIKKNLEELVERSQKEFKSDPFYWSLYVRPLFKTVKEYEEWDWTKKNYPYADIDIKVKAEVFGFGKQIKESEMEKVKD
ncbi:Ger(x)C family spore germination protein [Metabacillus malikii]|uniref:Ger(X)C family germination protein n=1 Tax=Metabacillus malikii TaxID=1504265 RepID=A0ABT9ZCL1_9BACI|nr:Ger(x)C family spore germination protein [Metabacillus malikii]MDQ0229988.1 Ger(x)C family germination protein [Metabacillus malikii]